MSAAKIKVVFGHPGCPLRTRYVASVESARRLIAASGDYVAVWRPTRAQILSRGDSQGMQGGSWRLYNWDLIETVQL